MAKESRFPYTTLGRESMLLLLTLVAASVDAISYLGLGHVFTAMMTGNTVLLGLALAQGEVLAALRSILALIGFSVGVFVGAMIVERESYPAEWPAVVTTALAFEADYTRHFRRKFHPVRQHPWWNNLSADCFVGFRHGHSIGCGAASRRPGNRDNLHYRNVNESDGGPFGLAPFHRRAPPGVKSCRTRRGSKDTLGSACRSSGGRG